MGDMKMKEEKIKSELIIFVVSFVIFVVSTSLIGLDQEPAKGSSEVPEYLHTDITDVRWLTTVVSCITMVCSGILLYTDIKR